jgi:hypothetical protein
MRRPLFKYTVSLLGDSLIMSNILKVDLISWFISLSSEYIVLWFVVQIACSSSPSIIFGSLIKLLAIVFSAVDRQRGRWPDYS